MLLPKNLNIKIYRNIILPVVLYGCETWSLTLREERKLRVFQNMVLRIIFGPRRDEVTGKWRRLHNEELNVLYCSPNIVRVIKWRRMRWVGHVARMGEERGVYLTKCITILNSLSYNYLWACLFPLQKRTNKTINFRSEKFEISNYELHLPVLLKTCTS